jgi:anti-sigma factor RsiW
MNITCEDSDRIFEDGTPAEWAALEAHSANCAACAEELRAWKAIRAAAKEMRDYSDSPSLWPRIEQALTAEAAAKKHRAERWNWLSLGFGLSLGWQTAVAAALVLVLTVSSGWFYFHRAGSVPGDDQSLLKSPALREVERTEADYEQAID